MISLCIIFFYKLTFALSLKQILKNERCRSTVNWWLFLFIFCCLGGERTKIALDCLCFTHNVFSFPALTVFLRQLLQKSLQFMDRTILYIQSKGVRDYLKNYDFPMQGTNRKLWNPEVLLENCSNLKKFSL